MHFSGALSLSRNSFIHIDLSRDERRKDNERLSKENKFNDASLRKLRCIRYVSFYAPVLPLDPTEMCAKRLSGYANLLEGLLKIPSFRTTRASACWDAFLLAR
jgi:hypothetical protein